MKYKYHCWNSFCKAYCGLGYMIRTREPIRDMKCPHCGHPLEDCSEDASPWVYFTSLVIGGWLLGLAIDGWIASLAGFMTGVIVGALVCALFTETNRPPKKTYKTCDNCKWFSGIFNPGYNEEGDGYPADSFDCESPEIPEGFDFYEAYDRAHTEDWTCPYWEGKC